MTIKTHTRHVSKSKDCDTSNPPLGTRRLIALKERQQNPQQADQAENKYAENFSVDEPHFGRDKFERLEHEEEVPLGFDSRWSRHKRICLDTEVPREERCQRTQ